MAKTAQADFEVFYNDARLGSMSEVVPKVSGFLIENGTLIFYKGDHRYPEHVRWYSMANVISWKYYS